MEECTRADELLARLGRPYEELHERFGSRHAELLDAVDGATLVRLVAEPCGEARWTVSIASVDSVGVLAVIAGLFAGKRVDIRNGDVFSLRLSLAASILVYSNEVTVAASAEDGREALQATASDGMLAAAHAKGCYVELHKMLLGEKIDLPAESFDAITAAGVLNNGHAPPECHAEADRQEHGARTGEACGAR